MASRTDAISPRKSLGQNFLRDPNIVRKIVDAVEVLADDQLVEIGSGTGALTASLAERHPGMIALEIDPRAVAHLRALQPDVDVRQVDVLDVDWPTLCSTQSTRLVVVGNLPYNITSPILFSLIEAGPVVREAVIMIQKEVARRLVAVPRTKDYGILSVVTQLVSEPKLLFTVSPKVFFPRPKVDSAVVRLRFKELSSERRTAVDAVRPMVRAAFNQRRKQLRNSLRAYVEDGGLRAVPEGIASRRAEELTPAEFLALHAFLNQV